MNSNGHESNAPIRVHSCLFVVQTDGTQNPVESENSNQSHFNAGV